MQVAMIPITYHLKISNIKTLEIKIKGQLTEQEENEIENPDLDHLSDTPRCGALLRFLRTKIHSKQVENKLN